MTHDERVTSAAKADYWNDYYSKSPSDTIAAPSQFAAFMAQECQGAGLIVEVGCGSGRDSIFFARQGYAVVAFDGSDAAIEGCTALKDSLGLDNIEFAVADVGAESFAQVFSAAASAPGRVGVYARFFLHAITEAEQSAFLDTVARTLKPGDILALEFRTVRDAPLEKVTSAHYRRYVYPPDLHAAANARGFVVTYAVEGFGFAKFRRDDAYVARCILEKV